MRYLVCLLVGLAAGALIAMTIASALQKRDAWPRAVMNVMQHELGAARAEVRGAHCTATGSLSAHAHLQLLAGDLEGALLAPGTRDRVFSQYASDLRAAIAQWDVDAACKAQDAALAEVGNACDACHRDYR